MRNSILITCHYPDLGTASDWLKRISLARITRSTTQMWVVTGHQYGISAPVPQTSLREETFSLGPGNEVVGGGVKERSDTAKTNDFPWLPSRADYFSVLLFQCGAWSQARKLVVGYFYWRRFSPFPVAKWFSKKLITCCRHQDISDLTIPQRRRPGKPCLKIDSAILSNHLAIIPSRTVT